MKCEGYQRSVVILSLSGEICQGQQMQEGLLFIFVIEKLIHSVKAMMKTLN